LNPPFQEQKDSVFNRLSDENEEQSSFPYDIKWFSTLDVITDGSLRYKRHTVVFTI